MCNHIWVRRKDGYEEGCCPAICLTCGRYGCYCNFSDTLLEASSDDVDRMRKEFEDRAIDGNKHEIEKCIEKNNKYIEENNKFTRFEMMDI